MKNISFKSLFLLGVLAYGLIAVLFANAQPQVPGRNASVVPILNNIPLKSLAGGTANIGQVVTWNGSNWEPDSISSVVTNLTVITNLNNITVTNVTVYDSLTINTNVTVNQNISVSGKATFNNITVTNQLSFTTNAFPLAAGTSWDLSKPYQLIVTNASFVIDSLGGLTNNTVNWGVLIVSNSSAAAITVDLTALSVHLIGSNSTNSVSVSAGKEAVASIMSWGVGVLTNLVTATE